MFFSCFAWGDVVCDGAVQESHYNADLTLTPILMRNIIMCYASGGIVVDMIIIFV